MRWFEADRFALAAACFFLVFAGCGSSESPPADLAGDQAPAPQSPDSATKIELEDLGWPREIQTDAFTILIYQPQLESFVADDLKGRAAVSVTRAGEDEPVFGAVWLEGARGYRP